MNRQTPCGGGDSTINRYDASQLMQMSAQRLQQNSQFPSPEDGRKQWDRNPPNKLPPVSPRMCPQGYRGDVNRSISQEQMVNRKGNVESEVNVDSRVQSFEQDMEIGYEENGPAELTFEGLEQKFQDEIMKSVKEQSDLEDEEIVRHKEKMLEINKLYQERISSLRVQHAACLGELLRKESETRLHHYKQAAITTHQTERGPTEPRDYATEARRRYGTLPNDSYRSMAQEPPRPYGTMPNDSYRSMAQEPPRAYGTMPNDSYRSMATEPQRPYGIMLNNSYRLMATEPPRLYGTMPNDSQRSMATEPPRPYGTMPNDSYREPFDYRGAERNRVSEERVPIPHGRIYNNSGTHH